MRIAVVGSGVAGLVCAHLLDADHDVTVFEADDRLGGHTNTIAVDDPEAGPLAVDTGFIVHNDRNYPNLLALFDRLGVATQPSEMSFSVTEGTGGTDGFTYRATNLATLLARPSNAVDRRLWRMLYDIARFYRSGRKLLAEIDSAGPDMGPTGPHSGVDDLTIADYLRDGRYSDTFVDLHLRPMGAAVWSTAPGDFDRFPAVALLRFLDNHGLLSVGDRPQWRTVVGGSRAYVDAIAERFTGTIHLGRSVTGLTPAGAGTGVRVSTADRVDEFDAVILACHSDQALRLLEHPTAEQRRILGAIEYRPNTAVLHTDTSVLSSARRSWAAWNYHAAPDQQAPQLTYDMTTLQRLPGSRRYLVTLNPSRHLDGVIGTYHYAHPQFTVEAMAAQRRFDDIDGVDGIHFCGAYWGYGFHEDGVRSALRVCAKFGAGLAVAPAGKSAGDPAGGLEQTDVVTR
jgi:predicted NAD/FAD-binding protein